MRAPWKEKTSQVAPAAKKYSPDASTAIRLYLEILEKSLKASAERISVHESILKADVVQAIEEMRTPVGGTQSRKHKVSDWLKWIGFLCVGIAIPAFITVCNEQPIAFWSVMWLLISFGLGFISITAAFVIDFVKSS